METKCIRIPLVFVYVAAVLLMPSRNVWASQENGRDQSPSPEKTTSLTLVSALICEGMKDFEPENPTIIISAALGQAICFTAFDPVPGKTEIYHNWFKRDKPDARFKLALKPPKWACFSKIRLRNSDIGPWRVDITDANGKIFQTLRFSVTE